jgi:uncharacterized protein YecE (DUF72 family)
VATESSVEIASAGPANRGRLYAGASGFSYASWKPEFYPADAKPSDFLGLYAERLPTVELNNTFYRLPAAEQFGRWADQTPPNFRFAVKLPMSISILGNLGQVGDFSERVAALGERLGPALVRLGDGRPRDDGFLELLLGSVEPSLRVALDARDASWEGADDLLGARGAIRVNAVDGPAPFRYFRFRDPPYDESTLAGYADRVRDLLADGIDVYCYFRHEDAPTAPRYARRFLELVGQAAR